MSSPAATEHLRFFWSSWLYFPDQLGKVLDEGIAKSWTIVVMKKDWKTVFAFQ